MNKVISNCIYGMLKKCIIVIIASLSLTSCFYDVEDELYPVGINGCDTSNVSYNQTVKPILENNCYTCHNGGFPSGGVNLETYESVKQFAVNGKLVGTINHTPGFKPMPQGGNKLLDCDINKIRSWVNAGAQNN